MSCSQVKPMPPKVWIASWVTEVGGVGGARLRHRGGERQRLGLGVGGPGGVVGERARLLDLPEHLGEPVRDRLVGADRAAELLALLRVLDRHVERALGDADELGGERDHGRRRPAAATSPGSGSPPSARDAEVGAGGVDQVEALERRRRRARRARAPVAVAERRGPTAPAGGADDRLRVAA